MNIREPDTKGVVWRIRSTIGLAGIGLISVIVGVFVVRHLYGLDFAADVATIVALVIGGLAFVLFLWVHRTMGPKLTLRLGERAEGERNGSKWAFLHLEVTNEQLIGWSEKRLSSVFRVQRRHAHCQVLLHFLSMDERTEYISSIPADWARTPEPITFHYDPSSSSLKAVPDISKVSNRWSLDVHATGYGESVAVAVKHEGQQECYAFNAHSYFGPTTSRPWCIKQYELNHKETLVHAYLISGGTRQGPYRFRLINCGSCITKECFGLEKLD